MSDDDTNTNVSSLTRGQAYQLALVAAKSEYDEIAPEFKRLVTRVNRLRMLMRAASELLSVELEDKYRFPHEQEGYYSSSFRKVKK